MNELQKKTKKLKEEIERRNILKNKVQSYFEFEVPDYVIDDIISEEYYEHICLIINVAVLNKKITEKNAQILKEKLKEICQINNVYDKVKVV